MSKCLLVLESLALTINDPADLRRLSRADLKVLATELREFVLQSTVLRPVPPLLEFAKRFEQQAKGMVRECRQLLSSAFEQDHPVAVRYPRGSGAGVAPLAALDGLPFGKGEIRRERKGDADGKAPRIAILAFGTLLYPTLEVGEAIDATVVNMRWAKPIDEALLREVAERHDALVTVEEGAIMGGAGSAVTEALNAMGLVRPVLQLGLADVFIEHGDPAKLLALQGLDAAGIRASIAARTLKVCVGAGISRENPQKSWGACSYNGPG
eukprot:gene6948-7023_t